MYRMPSRRKRNKVTEEKINLVPMMDAIFNFIFFLLITSSFVTIFQISSPLPIISDKEPPKQDKKPLALTVSIDASKIIVKTGVPSRVIQTFTKEGEDYPWENIHLFFIDLKKNNMHEDSAILEPDNAVAYLEIVKLMDSIRILGKSDESLYSKDAQGVPVKLELLFSTVLFGNITG
jgi:biopolymer transport protein ExbD